MDRLNRISFAAVAFLAFAVPGNGGEIEGEEAELRHAIELDPHYENNACRAQLEVTWYQAGSSVHVESLLTNRDCGASSGTYSIEVRYRDAEGELVKLTFPETWSREDDRNIAVEKDYALAENIDVVRVRSRKLRCECAGRADTP